MVDKNLTYQIIEELRRTASEKPVGDFDKILMRGAANVMETNIRAHLDIASEPPGEADAKCRCDKQAVGFVATFNGPMCTCCGKIRTA